MRGVISPARALVAWEGDYRGRAETQLGTKDS
nr:MAG TPA: hypothetical protein [Caudoviricetes sp.]